MLLDCGVALEGYTEALRPSLKNHRELIRFLIVRRIFLLNESFAKFSKRLPRENFEVTWSMASSKDVNFRRVYLAMSSSSHILKLHTGLLPAIFSKIEQSYNPAKPQKKPVISRAFPSLWRK